MKLILTEEQQFLKDTAQSFARDKTPVTHLESYEIAITANAGMMVFGKKWLS